MPKKISTVLGISEKKLTSEGIFDAFVDIDSKFHIDPHLLQYTTIPEFKDSYKRFKKYFKDIVPLLEASQKENDRFWREARQRLIFREVPFVSLGYSVGGGSGRGIGPGLANRIVSTAADIVKAGIKDPIIFELVGLLEENIGADRISDMAISIILPDLLKYSERVAKKVSAQTKGLIVSGIKYEMPNDPTTQYPIIMIPKSIISPLPVAYSWNDIDIVCGYNEALRKRVNALIGDTWKYATANLTKKELKDALLKNPEVIKDLIAQYKAKSANEYDFDRDPLGEFIWHKVAHEYAKSHPLDLGQDKHIKAETIADVVTKICDHFRELVENNGLYKLFYDDSGKLKHERAAQLLFFGIADAYCEANNLDLNREPNAGHGPVDFKVSSGYKGRVTVEVKYSSNPNLSKGYTTQLPIYNKAEKTTHSFYLVIRIKESEANIKALTKIKDDAAAAGTRTPVIKIIDGRVYPTASHR